VLAVFGWTRPVIEEYVSEVRPRFDLGLDPLLHPHCLRHSYVLIEDGFDPLFVQQQVGHRWGSTTALYTGVSGDYRNRTLRRALDAAFTPLTTIKGG
jgi:integrase/recombinase XerC